jgi:hypothetical protein
MAKPRAPIAPPPAVEEIDESPAPAAIDETTQLDELLEQCGASVGQSISISRIEPTRGYVARVPAKDFDVEELRRNHGGGLYELRVYNDGEPGVKRRASIRIDGAPRNGAAEAKPAALDQQSLLLAMMNQNAQIVSAIVSRPPPTPPALDPAVLALIGQRSSAGELAELLRITRDVAPQGDESSLLSTITAAIAAFAANQKMTPPTAAGGLPFRRPTPLGAQKRALPGQSHYGRSGAGGAGPTLTPQPPAPNETRQAQAGNSASTPPPGSPEAPQGGEMTVAEAIQAVFATVKDDPLPMPLMYAARLVQVFGPDKIAAIVRETDEGGIVDQVSAILPPMPDGFLQAVEDFLRDQFEDTPDPSPASAALRIGEPAEVKAA